MADPKFLRFDTLSLHAGQQPDPATGARAVPMGSPAFSAVLDSGAPLRPRRLMRMPLGRTPLTRMPLSWVPLWACWVCVAAAAGRSSSAAASGIAVAIIATLAAATRVEKPIERPPRFDLIAAI